MKKAAPAKKAAAVKAPAKAAGHDGAGEEVAPARRRHRRTKPAPGQDGRRSRKPPRQATIAAKASAPEVASPPATVSSANGAAPTKAIPPAEPAPTTVETVAAPVPPVVKAPAKAPVKPVRPPEPWSAAELAEVRRQLEAELADMRGEYDRSMDDLTVLHQTGTDGAGDDQADAGSKTFEREQELAVVANRMDLLNQIQRAIERVEAGTYGICESCGRPIPKARLKAFPMATLDVECKQREERR